VALRPRLSPGVPFVGGIVGQMLGGGTIAVKMLVVQRLNPFVRAATCPDFR